jgi:hypothetical protein
MSIYFDATTIHPERLSRTPLGFEAGIAFLCITTLAPTKEIPECGIEIAEAGVYGTLGHIVHPWKFLALYSIELFF